MQKSLPAIEALGHGTQVMYRWASWQKKNQASALPMRIAIFRKEEFRLVVHQYQNSLCGVLKLADVKPKVRQFREWREPFSAVLQKLVAANWTLFSDSGEVQHERH